MKTAGDLLREKANREMIFVAADTSIHDALNIMVEHRIGAMLIRDGDDIVGIWTERDLMRNTVTPDFDAKSARIGDYMTKGLKSASYDESIYSLQDKFLGMRLRHLLVEKDGKFVGLLSTGDVVKANLMEKTLELKKLNEIVNWDYYENWRWKPE